METERLLTGKDVSSRLGLKPRTFARHRARLVAAGLQMIRVGRLVKFREQSLNSLIRRAAEAEKPLF